MYFTPFYVSLLLPLVPASPTPQSQYMTLPQIISNVTAPSDEIVCYEKPRVPMPILGIPDCVYANGDLPYNKPGDENPSEFSRTAADPRFRVPVTSLHGACKARVDLQNGAAHDYRSWASIHEDLSQIVIRCVGGSTRRGGTMLTGLFGDMRLSIGSPSDVDPRPAIIE